MSLYAQAMQQGVSSLQLFATGENAATKAAYNQSYQAAAARINTSNKKHAAQLNISAIEQDKILSNTQIRMKQDQAEANARVMAAVAGVEGGSVEDVVYSTERNEALAINNAKANAEQKKAGLLSEIATQQSTLLAIDDEEINLFGNLLESFSSLEVGDFDKSEAAKSLMGIGET